MFGACLTVLNLTPLTPRATRRVADRCASVGARYAHAAVRGDATDAEEGTLRLWIAARDANVPGKIAFANGRGVDTSKDAIAHCAAAIEAFAECATRLGDDPATVANDALVEAQIKAARRVVARAKVRMAWRMETLRAQLETIEGECAREKTRADVAEARLASLTETAATRESESRESNRRENKTLETALDEATRRATREESRAATLESRNATLESRVATLDARAATLEHTLRASEEARASGRRDAPDEIATSRATNNFAPRRRERVGDAPRRDGGEARGRVARRGARARRFRGGVDAVCVVRGRGDERGAPPPSFRRERDDAETAKAAAETALREGDRAAREMTARLRERLAEAEEALAAERATAAKSAAETTGASRDRRCRRRG